MSPWRATFGLLFLLAAVSGLAWLSAAADPADPATQGARLIQRKTLPESLRGASDLRIASPYSVYLAAATDGVVEFTVTGALKSMRQVISPTELPGAARLATSEEYLISSFLVRSTVYKKLVGGPAVPFEPDIALDVIADLDLHGDQALLLAGWRGADGRSYAPGGALGWLATLGREGRGMRPVYVSTSGPNVPSFNGCALFELSAVRFLNDGSFLIVPGFEDGVYLYSPDGILKRTWDTGHLGIDTVCGLSLQEARRYAKDYEARVAWVNRRAVVDEILPLPSGPALVVREFHDGGASWRLLSLGTGSDSVLEAELPLRSPSPYSRLRGDADGNRIVLLRTEIAAPGATQEKPELLVLEVARGVHGSLKES